MLAPPVLNQRSRPWRPSSRAHGASGTSRIVSRVSLVDDSLDGQSPWVDNYSRVSGYWQSAAVGISDDLLARIAVGGPA